MDYPGGATATPEPSMPDATTWRFPRSFWTANGVELFDRAAYYGTSISLAL